MSNPECSHQVATYFLDDRIPLKSKLVIVVEICELLFGQLHPTRACDVIHASLLNHIVQHVALLVEPGRSDFSTFVEKVCAEEFSLSVLVVPRLYLSFVCTPRLDGPLVGIGRERFDGVDVAVGGG